MRAVFFAEMQLTNKLSREANRIATLVSGSASQRIIWPLILAHVALASLAHGATVTLTSPIDTPTQVSANNSMGPSGEFHSSSTDPFDQTAQSGGGAGMAYAVVRARLTLDIKPDEVAAGFYAGALLQDTNGTVGYMDGGFRGVFALDIVVDTMTPFAFEANIYAKGGTIGSSDGGYYRLSSDTMDFTVRSQDQTSVSGSMTGFFEPGITYHLEFVTDMIAIADYPASTFGAAESTSTARLLFNVPEPTSGTLLLLGGGFPLIRRQRKTLKR